VGVDPNHIDREKAWSSINHSILSWQGENITSIQSFTTQFVHVTAKIFLQVNFKKNPTNALPPTLFRSFLCLASLFVKIARELNMRVSLI
jgi:hypothetical protein